MVATSDALIERARRTAGLTSLGPDGWKEGLDKLIEAVGHDIAHDPDAVERIEQIVVDRLVTRLRIESWYAEHGADAAHPIEAPVLIVGLPRTATTALHFLLANDDRFRYPRAWEVRDPAPPPVLEREHDDPRRAAHVPATNERHIVALDGPAEDWPIHAMAFDHAELVLPVPSHATWWRRTADHTALFPYQERVLRMLHSRRPPHRWLLKTPAYVFLLREAAAHYPDATFVMTHRDPVAALASTCSTVADSRRMRTPSWSPEPEFGRLQLEHWSEGIAGAMAARDAIGDDRFIDVGQSELEADPVGVAQRIYERIGLDLDDSLCDAMAEFMAANQRGTRGEHRYSAEEYGLRGGEINDAFAEYLARYGRYCATAV